MLGAAPRLLFLPRPPKAVRPPPQGSRWGRGRRSGRGRRRRRPGGAPVVPRTLCPGEGGGAPPVLGKRLFNGGGGGFGLPYPAAASLRGQSRPGRPGLARAFVRSFRGPLIVGV